MDYRGDEQLEFVEKLTALREKLKTASKQEKKEIEREIKQVDREFKILADEIIKDLPKDYWSNIQPYRK